jgi:prepilin-type N-terminal cleavage/methylation domain-containing protein
MAKKPRAGFTLAEMAIVVLLAGILLTFGVGVVQSQLENAAITVTKKRQEAIRDALVGYLGRNHRLPCPDSPIAPPAPNVSFDGVEDRVTALPGTPPIPDPSTRCVRTFGVLPYITLGLSREMALDGWNNFFGYQVSNTPYNWTISSNFNAGSQGGIVIRERPGVGLIDFPTPAVAVLVSYGRNGSGAYTTKGTRNTLPIAADVDQLENTDGNNIYVRREFTDSATAPGGTFDDFVFALMPADLVAPAVLNKSVRSFDEEVNIATGDIDSIKSALTGFVIKNNRLPFADSRVACALPCIANDGLEDAGVYTGNIPWQTLAVPANDPWAVSSPPAPAAIVNRHRYRVTPALTSTASKAAFIAASGNIAVNDAAGAVLTAAAPFVVYSVGRNNVAFFNNAAGAGAQCTTPAPVAPIVPVAPNCLGANEVNNFAGNAPFVKAAMNLPPFTNAVTGPTAGYDDILDYSAKGMIDAKLP